MNQKYLPCVEVGTLFESVVPHRSAIHGGRLRWKDGGGLGADVLFVPGNAGGQGHRHSRINPRHGPASVPGLLGAEGAGTGGEPVLRQVPGQDPEAAQVSGPTKLRWTSLHAQPAPDATVTRFTSNLGLYWIQCCPFMARSLLMSSLQIQRAGLTVAKWG